jgi:phi13 family phage major tail protein
MANGRVITGFSKPVVATYSASGTTVAYTSFMDLARGVDVSIDIETNDDNDFYANNVKAESAGNVFSSGTVTLTVDGLKEEARTLVMGLPAATSVSVGSASVDVYEFDDRQVKPYVGVGFIVRYMEDGVTSFVPYVLPKTIFSDLGIEAETQEESIDFQTTELEATIMRDDSENHRWQRIGDAQTTEDAAYAVLSALLGGQ